MRKRQLPVVIICLSFLFHCSGPQPSGDMPAPTQIYSGQEEEQENGYERFLEISHRTAPGVDWRAIEAENRRQAIERKGSPGSVPGRESFAGGLIEGDWHERGSTNQAGSVIAFDYYPATDQIYTVASSGIMFRGNRDGSGWGSVNDDIQFSNKVVEVVPNLSGDKRLIGAVGKFLYYSDDDGSNWTLASGLSFYDGWGNPLELVETDNHDLYYLVYTWISSPWGSGFHLYRSTNRGANWSLIQSFPLHSTRRVALWRPFETNELYVVDNNEKLYTVSGSTVSLLNNISGLPTNQKTWLSGYKNGSSYRFYILTDTDKIYRSLNDGASWTLISTVDPDPWDVGHFASPFQQQALYYGAVEFWKSSNDGSTWSKQNNWWSYYSNTDLLHADIMNIRAERTTGGMPFLLIANHGGMYASYDNMGSTDNIGLSNLNVGQYYDHISATYSGNGQQYLFVGTQDQGMQRFSNAAGTGMIAATQVISGDYVKMHLSRSYQSLWEEYPYGTYHYYFNPFVASGTSAQYSVDGVDGENRQLWIVPSNPVGIPSENAILVGGGTTTGDDGSYLIKLTATSSPPYSISAFQFSYNFRPNANNGDSYITAVAQSTLNTANYYVATADGTFFYSQDNGSSRQKTASFNGPGNGFLYGTCILPSRIHPNRVFFSGSGYSNPGVYMSTDGGVTFNPLSTGIPATYFTELELDDTESMLFAATDAGPYVYIFSQAQWYSLNGVNTPLQTFKSVEYLPATNTARFATYGRGVWDLQLSAIPLPVEWVRFEVRATPSGQAQLDWTTGAETGNAYFEVQHSSDGVQFSAIGKVDARGSGSQYKFLHPAPRAGANYYRLRQVDQDGQFSYSDLRQLTMAGKATPLVFNNPVRRGSRFRVSRLEGEATFTLYDRNGRLVRQAAYEGNLEISTEGLAAGVYVFRLKDKNSPAQYSGKIVIE